MSTYKPPTDTRRLRACLVCSILKSQRQFLTEGCDNCEPILKLKGSSARIEECTSANYEGIIAMMNPEQSWVARYQRINAYHRGLYAMRVSGRLPEDMEERLESRGVKYFVRDGSGGRAAEG
ncbi:transcription initiation Spt4 [Gonapodya prolifera JEL478]|uniref:Transcription elongation factor SPT4 n=1 Tax=Gonapodya prolifera (strain JEL478) TaxID=1344416 RepID=A0A139ACU1_GONPJ|nr:transcription initiation Spt4 [Gonapodya prolifera JEL478]|eukprot:KXS14597.1 transcription initiation Spt4 [Gonapodya prolifera JEL478]